MIAVHRLIAVVLLVGVAVAFFFAGAGAFGASNFHSHRLVGMALVIAGVVGLVTAVGARRQVRIAGGLLALLLVQFLLGHLGAHGHPWVGSFHGFLALGVAGLAVVNARRAVGR